MKIEVAESLMYSWLKHVKKCHVVQLNWKTSVKWQKHHSEDVNQIITEMNEKFDNVFKKNVSSQLLSQGEIDVLGVNLDNKNIYAADVAFHTFGLRYSDNLLKISEKMLRTALILWAYFDTKEGNIIFACPKINNADYNKIEERMKQIQSFMDNKKFNYNFYLYANENFEQIVKDVVDLSKDVADTSELFLRSCQLCLLTQKK